MLLIIIAPLLSGTNFQFLLGLYHIFLNVYLYVKDIFIKAQYPVSFLKFSLH